MTNSLYFRVKQLCDDESITINRLEQTLGFGTSTITKWKTQHPSSEKIAKVANYFGVTTDYIIGISDVPYKIKTTNDQDLLTIQRAREQMSDDERDKMMKMLKLTFEYAFREGSENDDTI